MENLRKGTHGKDEKSFEKLSYAEQAKSLNAQILSLKKAINAHLRKGKNEGKDIAISRGKYISQLCKIIIKCSEDD